MGGATSTGTGPSSGSTEDSIADSSSTASGCAEGDPECARELDLLVVVDNSGSMASFQARFASTMLRLERTLATPATQGLDVRVMVTTTDLGNDLCTPFAPDGYQPANGAPTQTACLDRLDDFQPIGGGRSTSASCLESCPTAIPLDTPFIEFGAGGSNVSGPEVDIDGDGTLETAAAQALGCLIPQGVVGCSYESPLEAMYAALRPDAPWNEGPSGFLRPDATLGIILFTDEADCSAPDPAFPGNAEEFFETHATTGETAVTSAACWNAGTVCEGGEDGTPQECSASPDTPLHATSRYVQLLEDIVGSRPDKEVFMVQLVGVPPVESHSERPPFEPLDGGANALVYRDWQAGEFPAGDLSAEEIAAGVTADDRQFESGIGPGCIAAGQLEGDVVRGTPPPRLLEVCRSLNVDESPSGRRCCIESICDDDYDGALGCIAGLANLTTP